MQQFFQYLQHGVLLPLCPSASPAFCRAQTHFHRYTDIPLNPQKLPGKPGQVQRSRKHSPRGCLLMKGLHFRLTVLHGPPTQTKPVAHKAGTCLLPSSSNSASATAALQSKEGSEPLVAMLKHRTLGNSQTTPKPEPWGPATAPQAALEDSIKHPYDTQPGATAQGVNSLGMPLNHTAPCCQFKLLWCTETVVGAPLQLPHACTEPSEAFLQVFVHSLLRHHIQRGSRRAQPASLVVPLPAW